MLVRVHADLFVYRALHSNVQVRQNHQLLRCPQFGHAFVQQALARGGIDAGAGLQDRRAVCLFGPAAHAGLTRSGALNKGAYLFAFDHHVLEVRGKAAALKPGLAPDLDQQRGELAEVGGTFDRAGAKAQFLGHAVVVNRRVTAVLLVGQHLLGLAQRAAEVEGGIETHGRCS